MFSVAKQEPVLVPQAISSLGGCCKVGLTAPFPRSAVKTANTGSCTKLCAGTRGKWWEEANVFLRTRGQEGGPRLPMAGQGSLSDGLCTGAFRSVLAASRFTLA